MRSILENISSKAGGWDEGGMRCLRTVEKDEDVNEGNLIVVFCAEKNIWVQRLQTHSDIKKWEILL